MTFIEESVCSDLFAMRDGEKVFIFREPVGIEPAYAVKLDEVELPG